MSAVFTLQQVMEKQDLGPDARAFCEALLKHGEVLAVTLSYLPEAIVWLVTTPAQARIMRDTQPKAVVITLGEAADMATSVGAACPTSLWQVAVGFSAPPPPSPEDGPAEPDDPSWDEHDPWD